jgi:enoyl-CoA hydratase
MTQPFTTDLHPDGVAEVVINQPPVNALNAAGWHALAQNIQTLGQQPEVRVIVISAEGRGFCAGVDIKELNENPDLIVSVNAGNYATFKAVHLNPVPVIAAVAAAPDPTAAGRQIAAAFLAPPTGRPQT